MHDKHPDEFVQGKSRGKAEYGNHVRHSDLCLQVGELLPLLLVLKEDIEAPFVSSTIHPAAHLGT